MATDHNGRVRAVEYTHERRDSLDQCDLTNAVRRPREKLQPCTVRTLARHPQPEWLGDTLGSFSVPSGGSQVLTRPQDIFLPL